MPDQLGDCQIAIRHREPNEATRTRGRALALAPSVAAGLAIALFVAGCAVRPTGNLIAVSEHAPGADVVDMLVATTRAPVEEPPGVMFGGERAVGLAFADIAVSIPPDSVRKIG